MEISEQSTYPQWVQDIERLIPIRAQFLLSGHIRDRFLTPTPAGLTLSTVLNCLWSYLESKQFTYMLVYDSVDGIRVFPDTAENQKRASETFSIKFTNGSMPVDLGTLLSKIRQVIQQRDNRIAFVIDYASRIVSSPQSPSEDEKRFFVGCEKLAQSTQPLMIKEAGTAAFYNPVIWLLNRAQDLPSWYTLDSERVHAIEIGKPSLSERESAARALILRFAGAREANEDEINQAVKTFTNTTDELSLQAMQDISLLATHQKINFNDIDDAIRAFKVGGVRSPWKAEQIKNKIADAATVLEERVKGQKPAIVKTVDILTRSVMGLTGAQARTSGMRPRGVLFFAGPTGVGKTELAKSLTQLLFGDETHYIRFDMSEFAEEHASARLLGAPPGYVGYDAGGELTNRIRQKPFSVILFDEIEKAHPRLLDKFLQILEDGRLTDGRGETVYFSESVIIFTSNLGTGKDQNGAPNIKPDDSFEIVEERIRNAIAEYFKYQLSRPEILNRIGDNVVVFNFIRQDIAQQIFTTMLNNVINRVREEHRLTLSLSDEALEKLSLWCTQDLANGGRGIGNKLETTFINPLARGLFHSDLANKTEIRVTDIIFQDSIYTVQIE